ncbi:MAG: TauD/TfdA family dioxygenase [Myxococcales bacterium]|nr:TauD/TfdA family dioxygenase [Myxococcales bacterium]
MALTLEPLAPFGARIVDPDVDYLLESPDAPDEVMRALEQNCVLLFRGLHLDDATQLAFAQRLGEIVVKHTPGWSAEFPGIYRVALDPSANDELYVKGSWDWHIDGATMLGAPAKASLLSCRVPPGSGGETEFVDTYAAYERLSREEKERVGRLKVWHKVRADAYSTPINLAPGMRERLEQEPAQLHPLVWTHRDGRRSLVLGVTTASVEGLEPAAGRTLLDELLAHATQPSAVLSHTWQVDDVVMWDNRGTMHRARPYADDSGRDMHRITLVGDEPIQ